MVKYATQALIFRKKDINEADRVFSIFTNNYGQIDVFAKAIRKSNSKLKSGIDLFFLSDIEFVYGRSKKTLTDAIFLNKFVGIINNLEKYRVANKISDILQRFIKGEEKDSNMFDLLKDSFDKLNHANLKGEKSFLIYYYFLWNALSLLGHHFEVNNCIDCQKKLVPYNIYFSEKEGGIICSDCFKNNITSKTNIQQINSSVVKILRIILSKDWNTLFKLKIDKYDKLLLSSLSQKVVSYFCLSH